MNPAAPRDPLPTTCRCDRRVVRDFAHRVGLVAVALEPCRQIGVPPLALGAGDGTIAQLRGSLRIAPPQQRATRCPACGHLHVVVAEGPCRPGKGIHPGVRARSFPKTPKSLRRSSMAMKSTLGAAGAPLHVAVKPQSRAMKWRGKRKRVAMAVQGSPVNDLPSTRITSIWSHFGRCAFSCVPPGHQPSLEVLHRWAASHCRHFGRDGLTLCNAGFFGLMVYWPGQ